MALNSLTDRMSEQLDEVVRRRTQNWDYIKRAHQGEVHWLNVIKLSKSAILKGFPPEKLSKRLRRWFMLGLSIGRLLELAEGATMVRALGQLIEEYEHFIAAKKDVVNAGKSILDPSGNQGSSSGSRDTQSGASETTAASIPFLFLTASSSPAPLTAALSVAAQQASAATTGTSSSAASADLLKASLKKVGKEVVYEYLQTTASCMPEHLDYCEIVQSLCDCLCLMYAKFLDPSCQPPVVHEAILRLDRKLKQLVLSKISNDLLTEVATPLMKGEIRVMLNHQFVDEKASTMHSRKYFQLDENNLMAVEDDDDDK